MKKYLMGLIFIPTLSWANLDPEAILQRFSDKTFNDGQKGLSIMSPLEKVHTDKITNKSGLRTDHLQTSTDYRYRDTPVKRQFGSTCSAFGLIASMENALNENNIQDLSERHLWNKYRRYSSERAVRAALNKGAITDEKFWPVKRFLPKIGYKKNANTYLVEAPYIADDIQLALEALNEGRPVYIGLAVTEAMGNCDSVLDPNSPATSGGHAVSIVGYQLDQKIPGGGYFILKNSWSKECGDNGYQYMPFNYCTRDDLYCIMWDIKVVAQK